MTEWVRSLAVLGTAFVGVVVTTLLLAGVMVPGQAATPVATTDASGNPVGPVAATPMPTVTGRPGIGGTLAVTGDLTGDFRLTREAVQERYALTGDDGRIAFEGQPVEIVQLSYEGWEFFPDPEDCTITPLDLDTAIGLGMADVVCTDIEDIRDKGTISLEGTLGIPIDLLAERTLPQTGGRLVVGHENWTIPFAYLFTWQMPMVAGNPEYNLELYDETAQGQLNISYDIETHALTPVNVERDGEQAAIPGGACQLRREELGKQNPRTTVIELTISCPEVEVPGLGPVPISGTVVVDELAWPE